MAPRTPVELRNMEPRFHWDDEVEECEVLFDVTRAKRYTEPAPVKKAVAPKLKPAPVPRSIPAHVITPLLERADSSDIENARSIVAQAKAGAAKLNRARFAQPLRPQRVRPCPRRQEHQGSGNQQLFHQRRGHAAAADHARDRQGGGASGRGQWRREVRQRYQARRSRHGHVWMQDLARKGTVPWGDDSLYVVFRNVLDYSAVGDGVTDDTEAINDAMTCCKRCGEKFNGPTTKNAIVYFPPGNYLISSTVPMPFGTQVIGDASDRPTLMASADFVGLGVLSTDEYTDGQWRSEEYYIKTANFYRQIRNTVIDITSQAPASTSRACTTRSRRPPACRTWS